MREDVRLSAKRLRIGHSHVFVQEFFQSQRLCFLFVSGYCLHSCICFCKRVVRLTNGDFAALTYTTFFGRTAILFLVGVSFFQTIDTTSSGISYSSTILSALSFRISIMVLWLSLQSTIWVLLKNQIQTHGASTLTVVLLNQRG